MTTPSAVPSIGEPASRPLRRTRTLPSRIAPLLLTPIALFIHGYHPFANDADLYIAAVRRLLDPALYPLNAVFVTAFTRWSAFPWTLAGLVRLTHLPLPWILLATHLLSIVLFLTACRLLATRLFVAESARWCAVLLAAACCALPVAGTALVLMDPYVTARSFSTPLALFAVAACLRRAWLRTALLLTLAVLIHPLMGAYAVAFILLLALIDSGRLRTALALSAGACAAAAGAFAMARHARVSDAYYQAVSLPARTFLFLGRWQWYEILGLVLPLLLFAAAARRLPRRSSTQSLCFAAVLLGSTAALMAVLFVPPAGPYLLVPLQVLRGFHILYAVGIVLLAAPLAALMQRARFAGIGLLILIFAVMFLVERVSWPGSHRIEWPGMRPANPYEQAFLWIRGHTPADAVFAFDPQLVYQPGEDEQGFRVLSERDQLADDKDAGVVAVVPRLAQRWAAQRNAEASANRISDAERRSRLMPLGATWLLLAPNAPTALPCPFRNAAVQVCQMR
ncbi:MAG: hypothetical protein WA294_01120 [Acidobacteriaceae bacterium]